MRIGDKFIYIGESFTGEKGVIDEITDTYIIVNLEDGKRIKCLPQEIQVIEDPAPNTITITLEEFKEAVAKVVNPCNYTDDISDYGMITALCLSGGIVCKKLAKELFGDKG